MNIYRKKDSLIIEIPYKQDIYDCFSDNDKPIGDTDNIIGLIVPRKNNDDEVGFAQQIDMSYKGKQNQWTDIIFQYCDGKEKFKKLCKDLDIEVYEYLKCNKCRKAIFGASTIDKNGKNIHLECNK